MGEPVTASTKAKDWFPLLIVDTGLWTLDFTDVNIVPPDEIPEPYHHLLVHHHHMTVTVEDFYQSPVDVHVMARARHGESYQREILLTLQGTSRVVQYGIVRIDLTCCSEKVRDSILEEQTPLGRVLIENNVLRRIEPTAFLKIDPGPKLCNWVGMAKPSTTYGRMGVIFCDDRPAIAVLEILTPI